MLYSKVCCIVRCAVYQGKLLLFFKNSKITYYRKYSTASENIYTWNKSELLLHTRTNSHGTPYFIFLHTRAGTLNILVVLDTIKLIMVRNEAVVKMIEPSVADGTEKTATMEHMIFNSNSLQNNDSFTTSATTISFYSRCAGAYCIWLQTKMKQLNY